jgi:ABC-type amino acid transport substrate-binding protein
MGLKQRTLLIGSKLFLSADDESASPQDMIDALEANKIDIGLTWDPAVGYFLKNHPDLVATTIPNTRSQGYPEQFTYPMAMATREKDVALNADLNRVIATHGPELHAVLHNFNITFYAPPADSSP